MHGSLFLAAAIVLVLSGQSSVPQQPLRSRVVLVPIDVRVVDAKGNPVPDLTKAHFEVRENGVVQEIAHFAVATPDGVTTVEADTAFETPTQQRTFLIVFGRGDFEGPVKALTAARNFVASRLRPTDRVGVLAYKRVTDLTTDHAAILKLMDHFKARYRGIEMLLRDSLDVYFHWYQSDVAEDRIDALFNAPGLPPTRHIPSAFPPSSLNHLTQGMLYLRNVPGEKHLIFINENPVGSRSQNSFGRAAADARIVLSAISTRGSIASTRVRALGPTLPIMHTRSAEDLWTETDFRALAAETGGQAFVYAHGERALDAIERASRVRYLLGYYPASADAKETYRKVTVTVKLPGTTVLSRQGYYARNEDAPNAARETLTGERIRAAGRSLRPPRDIGVSGSASVVEDSTKTVRIDLQIQTDKLVFAIDGDRRTAAAEVAIYVGDAKQKVIGELRKRVDISRVLEDTEPRPVTFSHDVPVTGVPRYAKVIVYDYDGDRAGVVVFDAVARKPKK